MTEEELRERLTAIEESLAEIKTSPGVNGIRNCPEPDTLTGELLLVLYEDGGWMTAGELEERTSREGVTRALTRMYRSFIIDRRGKNPYRYRVNHHGANVVEGWGTEDESQQSLVEAGGEQDSQESDPDPWDGTDLNRPQYLALEIVAESDGGPKQPEELSEPYSDHGYDEYSNGRATIGPRLSELYKKGYVDRTPDEPHYYWVTDQGEKLLNE